IIGLFNNSTAISIIGNEQLNRPLTNLANVLSQNCKCQSDASHQSNLRHMNKQCFSWSSELMWISLLSIKQMVCKFLLYSNTM
ncbi:hypothetical protein FB192DRAFT_1283702, partial [Mucor lusitanicus]